MISAVIALVSLTRSCGATATSQPRLPALHNIRSQLSAEDVQHRPQPLALAERRDPTDYIAGGPLGRGGFGHRGFGHAQRRRGCLQRQLRRHRHDRDGKLVRQRDDQRLENLLGLEIPGVRQVGDDVEVQNRMWHTGFDERGDPWCCCALADYGPEYPGGLTPSTQKSTPSFEPGMQSYTDRSVTPESTSTSSHSSMLPVYSFAGLLRTT